MRMQAKQSGFTLIELVVVITILAILAAFAVPRFASLEKEARSAATSALQGSVRSSAALAHALWLAQGQPASVTMEGAAVALAFGYPDAASIDDTLASTDGFLFSVAGTTTTFSKTNDGSTAIANCNVTYTESTGAGLAPAIGLDVSGC